MFKPLFSPSTNVHFSEEDIPWPASPQRPSKSSALENDNNIPTLGASNMCAISHQHLISLIATKSASDASGAVAEDFQLQSPIILSEQPEKRAPSPCTPTKKNRDVVDTSETSQNTVTREPALTASYCIKLTTGNLGLSERVGVLFLS